MFEKIKAYDKSLDEKFSKFSLSKKYPGYFTRGVFKFFALLMFLFVVATFWQQGWTLNAVEISCPIDSRGNCQNPVYDCTLPGATDSVSFCSKFELHTKPQAWVCDIAPCDKPYLTPGESYSNAGWLIQHGIEVIVLLILSAFLVNALIYRVKFGRWLYVREE